MGKPLTHNCHECGNEIPYGQESTGKNVACRHCRKETTLGENYSRSATPQSNPWADDDEEETGDGISLNLTALIIIIVLIGGGAFATWWLGFKQRSSADPVKVAEFEHVVSTNGTKAHLDTAPNISIASTKQPAKTPNLPAPPIRSLEQWRQILKQQGGDPSKLYIHNERLCYDELDGRNLAPVKGIPLNSLHFIGSQFTDVSPLPGMPLEDLNLHASPNLSDLSALKQLPLLRLILERCPRVRDLSALAQMNLEDLDLKGTAITNLSSIARLQLRYLRLEGCSQLDSLKLLQGHPTIETLILPRQVPDLDSVRGLPNLKLIGFTGESLKAPKAFWAEFNSKKEDP